MIRLDVSNFRVLKDVQLHDDSPLSVIIGDNEAGKSSLSQAIRFALTGEAYGRKGELATGLITHGEQRLGVKLTVGKFSVSRTTSSGDSLSSIALRLGVPPAVLPALFHSEVAGDGGHKAIRSFLDLVAADKFSAAGHFASDPDVAKCVEAALAADRKTTKQIIDYCTSRRAACKTPAMPVQPTVPKPCDNEIVEAQKSVAIAVAALAEAENTRNSKVLLGQELSMIFSYLTAVDAYQKAVAAASSGDPLANKRSILQKVQALNVVPLAAAAKLLEQADFSVGKQLTDLLSDVGSAIALATATLDKNPLPPSVPDTPVLPEAARDTANRLSSSVGLSLATVQELMASLVPAIQASTNEVIVKTADKSAASSRLQNLERAIGAWSQYEASVQTYETLVQESEVEWSRWDTAAKKIEEAHKRHMAESGDTFGTLVASTASSILQGRPLKLDADRGLSLGPEPMSDLSKSTAWRAEVAIMAAIARTCRSPLLVIDGADILGYSNRTAFFSWVQQNICPHFQHVIITATNTKPIEEEAASPLVGISASKYILRHGSLSKVV